MQFGPSFHNSILFHNQKIVRLPLRYAYESVMFHNVAALAGSGCLLSTQTLASNSPPSIAIAAPVLGGPESVRVVLNSTSSTACVIAGCVGHTSVHSLRLCHTCSDRGPRAWGSGGCALCVSQLQHPNLHGPRDVLVLHCTGRCSRNRSPESKLPGKTRKHRRRDSFVIATRHFPAAGTWHRRAVEGAGAKVAWRSSSAEYRG